MQLLYFTPDDVMKYRNALGILNIVVIVDIFIYSYLYCNIHYHVLASNILINMLVLNVWLWDLSPALAGISMTQLHTNLFTRCFSFFYLHESTTAFTIMSITYCTKPYKQLIAIGPLSPCIKLRPLTIS